MSEGRFRTALNGFNRQDVAAYIEGMAQRSKAVKEERDSLERQLGDLQGAFAAGEEKQKELESALAEQTEKLQEAEDRSQTLAEELQAARDQLARLREQLDTLQAASRDQAAFAREMDELRQKNAEMEKELEQSGEKYRQATEQAEEYALVKLPADQLEALDPAAVAGKRVGPYGAEVLAKRDLLPAGFVAERTTLEDIILFLAKKEGD